MEEKGGGVARAGVGAVKKEGEKKVGGTAETRSARLEEELAACRAQMQTLYADNEALGSQAARMLACVRAMGKWAGAAVRDRKEAAEAVEELDAVLEHVSGGGEGAGEAAVERWGADFGVDADAVLRALRGTEVELEGEELESVQELRALGRVAGVSVHFAVSGESELQSLGASFHAAVMGVRKEIAGLLESIPATRVAGSGGGGGREGGEAFSDRAKLAAAFRVIRRQHQLLHSAMAAATPADAPRTRAWQERTLGDGRDSPVAPSSQSRLPSGTSPVGEGRGGAGGQFSLSDGWLTTPGGRRMPVPSDLSPATAAILCGLHAPLAATSRTEAPPSSSLSATSTIAETSAPTAPTTTSTSSIAPPPSSPTTAHPAEPETDAAGHTSSSFLPAKLARRLDARRGRLATSKPLQSLAQTTSIAPNGAKSIPSSSSSSHASLGSSLVL
jgi:hypothetical protein